MPKKKTEKIVIIDGNALLHRAWHAIPHLTTTDGTMVNAVYGWMMLFLKMYGDIAPKYIAVTFDVKGGTFRNEISADYKANRKKQPDELYAQIPMIKRILHAFNINVYEQAGFEADDVIGTICEHPDVNNDKVDSIILTGDMDTLQLVDENTFVYAPQKGFSKTKLFDIESVKERFKGLGPEQVIDYKALRGDPSDNIPGVKGVGEKTAIDLLTKYESLDKLLAQLDEDPYDLIDNGVKKRIVKLLREHKEDAIVSKSLATIKLDVPMKFNLEDCEFKDYDLAEVTKIFTEFEFKSLLNKLPKNISTDSSTGLPTDSSQDINSLPTNDNYILVDTQDKLKECLKELNNYSAIAFDTETTGVDVFNDELLGISISGEAGKAWYIINKPQLLSGIKEVLENSKIEKYAHNAKFDLAVLDQVGIEVTPITFDTMIASYLINPGNRGHGLDNVVFTRLGHEMIPIETLIGKKGKNQLTLQDIELEKVCEYACEDADYTFQLVSPLKKDLLEKGLYEVFQMLEIPLISVLYEMEKNGIKLNTQYLHKLSTVLAQDLERIDSDIYKHAGKEFNINSPIQLQEILFNEMELPTDGIKKTKKGYSTAASELEKLQGFHPIIDLISEHRELSKLKSTYIDVLPELVDPKDRVHTQYSQTVAATGRLSSHNPNLQNIPIRTELGRKVREAFESQSGYTLVSVDYSQIELRVIASLSKDKNMMDAFIKGEDIHKQTAALVYDVPLGEVSKDQRYSAKAINFGIIYGLGAFGLARNINVSYQEARMFIDKYFEVYADVKKYLDLTKEFVKENGYVETLFGRRRYLPDIKSSVPMVKAAAERAAINAPVQGTAADIMKLAMIKVYDVLAQKFPDVKMLLQVHDELIFEVPDNQVDEFINWVRPFIEKVYSLDVPVVVDAEIGKNWGNLV